MSRWKTYSPTIFGRFDRTWRGMHQGFGPMLETEQFVRTVTNAGVQSNELSQRWGVVRRNQIVDSINSVHVNPTAKVLSIGTAIYTAPPQELYDFRRQYSQFADFDYDPTTWNDLEDDTWEDWEAIPSPE
jgi:hypothetical protein